MGVLGNGLFSVCLDDKWGLINFEGNVVVPFIFDDMRGIQDDLIWVMINNKIGFIDMEGNETVPIIYDSLSNFYDGAALFSRDGVSGFVDAFGNEIVLPENWRVVSDSDFFSEGLTAVENNGLLGFINKSGDLVIPFEYHFRYTVPGPLASTVVARYDFIDGYAVVPINYRFYHYKYGVIDIEGNTVIPFIYNHIRLFSEGLAAAEIDGKWGFIDTQGNAVVPFDYDYVWNFSEELAWVMLDGKWGLITTADIVP
jgi:hypothetical protein